MEYTIDIYIVYDDDVHKIDKNKAQSMELLIILNKDMGKDKELSYQATFMAVPNRDIYGSEGFLGKYIGKKRKYEKCYCNDLRKWIKYLISKSYSRRILEGLSPCLPSLLNNDKSSIYYQKSKTFRTSDLYIFKGCVFEIIENTCFSESPIADRLFKYLERFEDDTI